MLTIKNLVRKKTCIFLTLAAALAGCTPPGPKALLEGKRLLEEGHCTLAVEQLKTATSLLSSNALAWEYLGLACHRGGLSAEAERAYQRALFYDRDLTEAHYNLGCLWLEENKLDGARLELTTFTLRRGNSLPGLLKLGTVQLRLRDPNGAEKSLGEALRLSPQNVEALNGLGLARAQHGRFVEAAARFNEALKVQPGYAPALLNLAIVSQVYLRDHSGALEKYREYLALEPPPPNGAAVAGVVRQLEAELNPVVHVPAATPAVVPEAAAAPTHHPVTPPTAGTNVLRSVVAPKPEPASEAPKPGVVAPAAKPTPASAAPTVPAPTPKPAVVIPARPVPQPVPQPLRPIPAAAPVTTASTQTVAVSVPPPAAPISQPSVPAPVTAVAEAPNAPGASPRAPGSGSHYPYVSPGRPVPGNRAEAQLALARGLAAHDAHRLDEAIQEYQSAIEADPSFFEAHYNLGIAATQAGRISQALSAYESALAIRPESANARYNLALVLTQAKFPADALSELGKLLDQYPDEARAHLAMANIYAWTLKQPENARPHYQRVLELDPHDPQGPHIREWLKNHPR